MSTSISEPAAPSAAPGQYPHLTLAMARRIELWPTERLVPYARNARTHSPEQIAQIAGSILQFGFLAPILATTGAGIIAGHGRLLAACKLGLMRAVERLESRRDG